MSLLHLDVAKCVHTSNKFAICDACVSSCPVDTIEINNSQLSFVPNDCVSCGACVGACPTAAYSVDGFNAIDYVFYLLENSISTISCKEGIPCVAALNSEELLALALLQKSNISIDLSGCESCDVAANNLKQIHALIEDTNFLLQAQEREFSVNVLEEYETQKQPSNALSRRELLSKNVLQRAGTTIREFEQEVAARDEERIAHAVDKATIAQLKLKQIPKRRSLLMMALKRTTAPNTLHTLPAEEVSFISEKRIEKESCTSCQMCYRICPTGALSSDARNSVINFSATACVKCHSCHDVCEPNAITIKESFSLKQLYAPALENLVTFEIKRCDECGNLFPYHGGEQICSRCQTEEDEAKALWGIS